MDPFAYLSTWRRVRLAQAFKRHVEETWGLPETHPMFWFVENVERIAQKPNILLVPPRYMKSDIHRRYMEYWRELHGVTPAK